MRFDKYGLPRAPLRKKPTNKELLAEIESIDRDISDLQHKVLLLSHSNRWGLAISIGLVVIAIILLVKL